MKQIITFLVACILLFAVVVCAGQTDSSVASNSKTDQHCQCIHDDCGCCEQINWSDFKINARVCTNFTYLPNDYGISVTVTYNTYTIINETVSARNPPPMCFGIPELEKIQAHICARFYDLSFAQQHFHGCVKLSISVYHVIHKSVDVGCFNIPKEALLDAYATKRRELIAWIKEELDEVKYLKDEIPIVNMI